ncbi:MAG: glutathione S-transferase [Myxococcota bacterium]|nr:glutathione S-transferase [Myxococcota bacterium]
MVPTLYVGNRNYSSWSLRPWLVLKWSRLPFDTTPIPLGGEGYGKGLMPSVLGVSPTGFVPALHLGDAVVWDSLAISEWAAESAPSAHLWPQDPVARAVARSATCEMHSGFPALRRSLPCNIRRRASARAHDEDVRRELARVEVLWTELRSRFGSGGKYLFGARPTIADAFYTPVATRLRTYGVTLNGPAQSYAETVLADPAFVEWEKQAVAEPWTMPQWDLV